MGRGRRCRRELTDGRFRAELPEPPAGATTASLRVTAADADGGDVWQEVVPAFGARLTENDHVR